MEEDGFIVVQMYRYKNKFKFKAGILCHKKEGKL